MAAVTHRLHGGPQLPLGVEHAELPQILPKVVGLKAAACRSEPGMVNCLCRRPPSGLVYHQQLLDQVLLRIFSFRDKTT